jgi:Mor family transcriptional regulator
MARGPFINAEERNLMLRLEIAGKSRSEIARECKRSKASVTKVLGAKFKNRGRRRIKTNDETIGGSE